MITDLFQALLDETNPRGQPLLAALLYAYCPSAARWWLHGADPVPVFDPLWFALSERAAGRTLTEVLIRLGFESLLADVQAYLTQVEKYRRQHAAVQAPELLATFHGGRVALLRRFKHRRAIEALGGEWRNLVDFIHAWAFLFRDWTETLDLAAADEFAAVRVALTLPGQPGAAYLPAWCWTRISDSGSAGEARSLIGLVAWGSGYADLLRPELVLRAGSAETGTWPARSGIRILQRNGTLTRAAARLGDLELAGMVKRLAELAQSGPHPPLPALGNAPPCRNCGFQALCYTTSLDLTPLVLEF